MYCQETAHLCTGGPDAVLWLLLGCLDPSSEVLYVPCGEYGRAGENLRPWQVSSEVLGVPQEILKVTGIF